MYSLKIHNGQTSLPVPVFYNNHQIFSSDISRSFFAPQLCSKFWNLMSGNYIFMMGNFFAKFHIVFHKSGTYKLLRGNYQENEAEIEQKDEHRTI